MEALRNQLTQLELKMQSLARDNGRLQRQLGEAEGQGRAAERERDSLSIQLAQWQQRFETLAVKSGQAAAAPETTEVLPDGTILACPVCSEPIDLSGQHDGAGTVCPGCDADLLLDVSASTLHLAHLPGGENG